MGRSKDTGIQPWEIEGISLRQWVRNANAAAARPQSEAPPQTAFRASEPDLSEAEAVNQRRESRSQDAKVPDLPLRQARLESTSSERAIKMPYNTAPIAPRKEATGTTQLPLSRVKKMIQADPDVHACSNSAAFVVTVATELFIQMLAEKAHEVVKSEKKPRRNIQYRDIATAVSNNDKFEFLADVVPKTMTYGEAKKLLAAPKKSHGERSAEAGQTTLDGANPGANGVNGFGTHAAAAQTGEDAEEGDPNEQLKTESRAPRLSSGSTISNPASHANGHGKGNGAGEDVEMS